MADVGQHQAGGAAQFALALLGGVEVQEVVARAAKGLGGVAQARQVGQGVGPALARDEHLAHHGFDLQGFEQAGGGVGAVGFFRHLQGVAAGAAAWRARRWARSGW